MGILTACVMLALLFVGNRRMTGSDGRPPGLVREYKRVNALSWSFLVPFVLYFVWGLQYGIGGPPFMAGALLSGSSCPWCIWVPGWRPGAGAGAPASRPWWWPVGRDWPRPDVPRDRLAVLRHPSLAIAGTGQGLAYVP